LDPDIVAALDSTDCSVNPEDLLEDDFVAMVRQNTFHNSVLRLLYVKLLNILVFGCVSILG
jgi:hypothetical protein